MNLHNVRFALVNVGLWLTSYGANGRSIGTHLWPIEEGAPDDTPAEPPPWMRTTGTNVASWRWTPPRFNFRPFDYRQLFTNGYVPPLCGTRSQARRPRVGEGFGTRCQNCATEAVRRGIIPLTSIEAVQQSGIPPMLARELQEWSDAGRPFPWPPSQST